MAVDGMDSENGSRTSMRPPTNRKVVVIPLCIKRQFSTAGASAGRAWLVRPRVARGNAGGHECASREDPAHQRAIGQASRASNQPGSGSPLSVDQVPMNSSTPASEAMWKYVIMRHPPPPQVSNMSAKRYDQRVSDSIQTRVTGGTYTMPGSSARTSVVPAAFHLYSFASSHVSYRPSKESLKYFRPESSVCSCTPMLVTR